MTSQMPDEIQPLNEVFSILSTLKGAIAIQDDLWEDFPGLFMIFL